MYIQVEIILIIVITTIITYTILFFYKGQNEEQLIGDTFDVYFGSTIESTKTAFLPMKQVRKGNARVFFV